MNFVSVMKYPAIATSSKPGEFSLQTLELCFVCHRSQTHPCTVHAASIAEHSYRNYTKSTNRGNNSCFVKS